MNIIKNMMRSAAGDDVVLQAPAGTEYLTVLEVRYDAFLSSSWIRDA